jgi:hypothetical protein
VDKRALFLTGLLGGLVAGLVCGWTTPRAAKEPPAKEAADAPAAEAAPRPWEVVLDARRNVPLTGTIEWGAGYGYRLHVYADDPTCHLCVEFDTADPLSRLSPFGERSHLYLSRGSLSTYQSRIVRAPATGCPPPLEDGPAADGSTRAKKTAK